MDWLNYHHLFYFWTVAREGSITAACNRLLLSPPTISAQIRELEEALGEKLFSRSGRGLVLTESGRLAYRYADEIFSLGREFVDAIKGRATGASIQINIGVNDVLPKTIVYRLIEPVFHLPGPVRIECVQGTPAQLLPALAVHDLDLVLSDAPVNPQIRVRAYSHLLGESAITLFAAPRLAARLRKNFPQSLDGAPALLPAPGSALRIAIDKWFESIRVRPQIVAQFEDVALLSVCARNGRGFFAGHTAIEKEIIRDYRVQRIGDMQKYRAQFYAISVERRLRHPALVAITDAARTRLFS
ncbi:MAG TPA: LysR family transcriptional regulator [Phycisphaerae bacterium]|jgi:LysR family transcriptional activator of nhaA|nr:LysR family transcriptional regulator [Phycisphaerae bacterium]HOB73708.1 LysR family transcriptional regulator [Phycisphaerae bacterium]HOJ53418.1 LysR family transcriptional regulator [Phycisphaerae bacterium]HOL25458.1 LysR family transcriptional regulator [Phycisphaerae bacterium]HPP19865.1 LysR family transcriptional regulator [Phycisphaerae bacterium]